MIMIAYPAVLIIATIARPAVNLATGRVPLMPPALAKLKPNVEHMASGIREGRQVGICRLAERPFAYLLRGFLTRDECQHIMKRAGAEAWEPAETEGSTEVSTAWRHGCDVAYLGSSDDAILRAITHSAAKCIFSEEAWSRREELGSETELLQVLRYKTGGEYKVHWDACWAEPRAATVLYYLNGQGETWFPLACNQVQHPALPKPTTQREAYEHAFRSDPEKDGVRVRPREGDALLFYNFDETTDLDVHALHAGLPASSTKVIASQFFRARHAQAAQKKGWWTSETTVVPDHVLSSR